MAQLWHTCQQTLVFDFRQLPEILAVCVFFLAQQSFCFGYPNQYAWSPLPHSPPIVEKALCTSDPPQYVTTIQRSPSYVKCIGCKLPDYHIIMFIGYQTQAHLQQHGTFSLACSMDSYLVIHVRLSFSHHCTCCTRPNISLWPAQEERNHCPRF